MQKAVVAGEAQASPAAKRALARSRANNQTPQEAGDTANSQQSLKDALVAALRADAQQQGAAGQQQGQMPGAMDVLSGVARANPYVAAASAIPFLQKEEKPQMTQEEYQRLLEDEDSPQHKADRLAEKRKSQRNLEKKLAIDAHEDEELSPPEGLQDLQGLGAGLSAMALQDTSDDEGAVKAGAALDLRRDAQKEAALSFGARGGLAYRNHEIMERLNGFEATLDSVFNFRALLVKAQSGLLIEPPVVRESLNSLVVNDGGNEAAVADRIYDINKQAKIVTAPRDWRQYLIQTWISSVPRPPRLLWPKNAAERASWRKWVAQGWRAGVAQADGIFETNLARLVADYNGMVRYRMMLTQGMISQPYALHEDRGVTGGKTLMRIGDRALRITGPSQFLTTGTDLWKPADR